MKRLLGLLLWASLAQAEESLPPLIAKVVFDVDAPYSQKQLSEAVVLHEGRRLWPADVATSLRNLWLLGDFLPDIQIHGEGPPEATVVHFQLQRQPFIANLRIRGHFAFLGLPIPRWLWPSMPSVSKKRLYRTLDLKKNDRFEMQRLEKALDNLRDLLRRDGFYQAEITYKLSFEGKKVGIDIDVHRGPPAILKEVSFIGNGLEERASQVLRRGVLSQIGMRFDRKRFTQKLEKLRKRFFLQGYFAPALKLEEVIQQGSQQLKAVVFLDLGPRMELQLVRPEKDTPLPKSWKWANLPYYSQIWSRLFGNVYANLLPIWDDRSIDLPTLQRGEANLEHYYKARGYAEARVRATKTLRGRTNTAVIQYEIRPGRQYHVAKILFQGNLALGSKRLAEALQTRTRGTFRNGYYDPALIAEDIKRLRAIYRREGYHAVSIEAKTKSDAGGNVELTFQIEEGVQSLISEIRLEGDSILSAQELRDRLPFREGAPFSPDRVLDGQYSLFTLYTDRGFSSTIIQLVEPSPLQRDPLLDPPWPDKVVVCYRVFEGELAIFGPTILRGLHHSKRWVVAKELTFHRGEPFDVKKLYESATQLRELGLFSVKQFNQLEQDGPLKTILIDVEEQAAGTVGVGFGFSGRSGGQLLRLLPLNKFSVDALYRNLGGYGAFIGGSADMSFDQSEYRFKMGHPRFFSEKYALDLSMSANDANRSVSLDGVTTSYHARTLGSTLALSRLLNRSSRASVQYRFSDKKLSDLDLGDFIKVNDIGIERISSLAASLAVDSRDNPFNPSSGLFGQLGFEMAGHVLGSENNFAKLITQASYYRTLARGHVLATGFRLGLASELPFAERFVIGGYGTLRGFKDKIGATVTTLPPLPPGTVPEDSKVVVGGSAEILYNAEYRFPLLFGMGGQVWSDLGNVWDTAGQLRPWNLKTALGGGLRYDTPIGPLRFDIGMGFDERLRKKSWDYYFVVGHPF